MPVADAVTRLAVVAGDTPELEHLGLPPAVLRLRRAWPRAAAHLTLEYTGPAGVIAAQWHADQGELLRVARRTPGSVLTAVGGEPILLHPGGVDRRLPALRAALAAPGASLVAHRAERRATVGLTGAFLKILPPGQAATAAGLHRHVTSVRVPPVLAADDATGVLVLGTLPGVALHARLGAPDARDDLVATGAALRALHAQPAPPSSASWPHGPAEEAAVLHRWLDRLAPYAPALHAALVPRANRVLGALAGVAAAEVAWIHRDLHDKQVLIDCDGEAGFIDLDTATAGDPAIDLGNLAAHLQLRTLQAGRPRADAAPLRAALLAGYGAPSSWERRIALYEQASLVRLACVYAFRPGAPDLLGACSGGIDG